jgi:hypothetical protein
LSHGAPDSPVRHRTLSGAPATSPDRWILTVGASDIWATEQSLFTVQCAFWPCSDFCAHYSALTAVADDPWRCVAVTRWHTGQSGATLDSPVNYSRAAPRNPEGGKFGVGFPGAPDTVRWCTGLCSMAHRTVRCARPGHTSVVFCSLCLNPFLVFLLVCCEPLAPVELII